MRCLLPLLAFVSVFAADAPAPLRVFLRCGPKTHGPGDHDHPAFARDWRPLLNAAGMKVSIGDADEKGVQTFPSGEELARTDVLVIHRQGGGDFKPDERARVEKFAARGGSFVVIHAGAVAGNNASADFYKDLVGGSWRQKVTKWREGPMQLKFVDKAHGITQGVADFGMKDEIYYDMDLRADIHPLATAPTPKKLGDGFEEQTQLWTRRAARLRLHPRPYLRELQPARRETPALPRHRVGGTSPQPAGLRSGREPADLRLPGTSLGRAGEEVRGKS